MLYKSFLIGLIMIIHFTGFSQNDCKYKPNGTLAPAGYIDTLVSGLSEEQNFEPDTFSVKLTINAYIIRDASGQAGSNRTLIEQGIANLNQWFGPVNIKFELNQATILNEYIHGVIIEKEGIDELVTKHSLANTINLYIVDSILVDSVSRYGMTFFPTETGKNYIFLAKGNETGNFLTTQMGYFFGLLSTHEMGGGIEYVDESNCSEAGDYLCDTYADPNIYGNVDEECIYQGIVFDPDGEDYIPSVANLMSESLDECKCILSKGQQKRILFNYLKYRQYLR